jgi:glycosyltransferase involved in cell wall biosynthesis
MSTEADVGVDLTLILPALNEEASILAALERVVSALEHLTGSFEIIVIDDGSSDRTGELAEKFAADDPRVRVLRNEVNVNYGVSLARGIAAAIGEWVTHDGADLPLAPEDFGPFLEAAREADVVVATRRTKEAHSPWRRLTSATNFGLLRLLFSPACSDLNFVQFYRRSILERLPLTSTSPAFVTPELILRAEHAGYRVVEVEAEFRRRTAGKAHFGRPKDILWTLRDMLRLRLATWLRGWSS